MYVPETAIVRYFEQKIPGYSVNVITLYFTYNYLLSIIFLLKLYLHYYLEVLCLVDLTYREFVIAVSSQPAPSVRKMSVSFTLFHQTAFRANRH